MESIWSISNSRTRILILLSRYNFFYILIFLPRKVFPRCYGTFAGNSRRSWTGRTDLFAFLFTDEYRNSEEFKEFKSGAKHLQWKCFRYIPDYDDRKEDLTDNGKWLVRKYSLLLQSISVGLIFGLCQTKVERSWNESETTHWTVSILDWRV